MAQAGGRNGGEAGRGTMRRPPRVSSGPTRVTFLPPSLGWLSHVRLFSCSWPLPLFCDPETPAEQSFPNGEGRLLAFSF